MAGKTKAQLMAEKLEAFETGVKTANAERSFKRFAKEGVLAFLLSFSYVAGPLLILSAFFPGLFSAGLKIAVGVGLLGFAIHVGSEAKCFIRKKA